MQQPRRNAALRYGLMFGGILVVLRLIQAAIGTSGAGLAGGAGLGTSCLFFLIDLALLFVAGLFAARATGSVGQGSLAGLIGGLVGSVITVIIGIITLGRLTEADYADLARQVSANGSQISAADAKSIVTAALIIGLVIAVIILAGLGAGVGALGGLIGKNQYNGPTQMYQQSYYQGMPPTGYPQQPGYPPPPGYPPAQGYPSQQPGYPPAPTSPYPPTEGQQPPQYPGQQ